MDKKNQLPVMLFIKDDESELNLIADRFLDNLVGVTSSSPSIESWSNLDDK